MLQRATPSWKRMKFSASKHTWVYRRTPCKCSIRIITFINCFRNLRVSRLFRICPHRARSTSRWAITPFTRMHSFVSLQLIKPVEGFATSGDITGMSSFFTMGLPVLCQIWWLGKAFVAHIALQRLFLGVSSFVDSWSAVSRLSFRDNWRGDLLHALCWGKSLPQCLHLKGFSPVWRRICWSNACWAENDSPHCIQVAILTMNHQFSCSSCARIGLTISVGCHVPLKLPPLSETIWLPWFCSSLATIPLTVVTCFLVQILQMVLFKMFLEFSRRSKNFVAEISVYHLPSTAMLVFLYGYFVIRYSSWILNHTWWVYLMPDTASFLVFEWGEMLLKMVQKLCWAGKVRITRVPVAM